MNRAPNRDRDRNSPGAPSRSGIDDRPLYSSPDPLPSSSFSPFSPVVDHRRLPSLHPPIEEDPYLYPPPFDTSDSTRAEPAFDPELYSRSFSDLRLEPDGWYTSSREYRPQSTQSPVGAPRRYPAQSPSYPSPIGRSSASGSRGRATYHPPHTLGPTAPLLGTSAWTPTNSAPIPRAPPVASHTWGPVGPIAPPPEPRVPPASAPPVMRPDPFEQQPWAYSSTTPAYGTPQWPGLSPVEAAWSARPNAVLSSPTVRQHRNASSSTAPPRPPFVPFDVRSVSDSGRGGGAQARTSRIASRGSSHTSSNRGGGGGGGRGKGRATATSPERNASPERKPYHPKAPSGGSNWVMWVGNVPHDATQEEANEFFSDMSAKSLRASSSAFRGASSSAAALEREDTGIESIFLILQSHCAFVNYSSEAHLQRALAYFNGRPLRPGGVKLVCRIRRKAEEIKSGVGGQRGLGLHKKWVEQHAQAGTLPAISRAPNDPLDIVTKSPAGQSAHYHAALERYSAHLAQPLPLSQEGGQSSPSVSTTSTLLATYFPIRYFVLKAMTKSDLQLSADVGLWATQPHNEFVLDQAYRTSQDVYLIFGANKAGEFHGYARMEGSILSPSEAKFSLPPRDTSPGQSPMSPFEIHLRKWDKAAASPTREQSADNPNVNPLRPPSSSVPTAPAVAAAEPAQERIISPSPPMLQFDGSDTPPDNPVTPSTSNSFTLPFSSSSSLSTPRHVTASPTSFLTPPPQNYSSSSSSPISPPFFTPEGSSGSSSSFLSPPAGTDGSVSPNSQLSVTSLPSPTGDGGGEMDKSQWGTAFRVRWIQVRGLPFHSTRMLRNPWNKDREVKVSRDGTELEPAVGHALLELWEVRNQDSLVT